MKTHNNYTIQVNDKRVKRQTDIDTYIDFET